MTPQMRLLLLLLVAFAAAAAGCAAHTVSTSVRADQVGTKYARISGYMATRGLAPGGVHTESTPGAIRHDVILDEATLAKIDAREICVDLVLRTSSAHDEPFDQYRPSFEIDGRALRGVVESEVVSVYDYDFTGAREVVGIEGVAANRYIGMSVTQPTEQVFRVIERRGLVCAGRGGPVRDIRLDMTHPSWDVLSYHYHIEFHWQLE
jgi:hypothetical protein